MYKSCFRCGKIHDASYNCNVGKIKRKHKSQTSEWHKLRSSTAWFYKSLEIRERSLNLCAVCKDQGTFNYEDLEVHHIIKLQDDPTKLLDDSNLITLCTFHHKMADKGMIDKKYLRDLVKIRDNEFVK